MSQSVPDSSGKEVVTWPTINANLAVSKYTAPSPIPIWRAVSALGRNYIQSYCCAKFHITQDSSSILVLFDLNPLILDFPASSLIPAQFPGLGPDSLNSLFLFQCLAPRKDSINWSSGYWSFWSYPSFPLGLDWQSLELEASLHTTSFIPRELVLPNPDISTVENPQLNLT